MASRAWLSQIGLTPAKGTLVVVLAAVLAAVVLTQFGATKRPLRRSPRAEASDASHAPAAASESTLGRDEAEADSVWRAFVADEISYDPFQQTRPRQRIVLQPTVTAASAAGDERGPQVASQERSELEELQRQGVSVIFQHRGRTAAVIGDRVVSVGDVVNGMRVVSIDRQGIAVAPEPTTP